MIRASWNGVVLAESDDTVVVEGNHYFPADAVRPEVLVPSDHHTTCSWKGVASYHSIVANGATNRDAAWFYPEPLPAADQVRDRIAFCRGVKVETV